jgi:hypothetical protein
MSVGPPSHLEVLIMKREPRPHPVYDLDRKETDPCEALTPGCPVNHMKSAPDTPCETW